MVQYARSLRWSKHNNLAKSLRWSKHNNPVKSCLSDDVQNSMNSLMLHCTMYYLQSVWHASLYHVLFTICLTCFTVPCIIYNRSDKLHCTMYYLQSVWHASLYHVSFTIGLTCFTVPCIIYNRSDMLYCTMYHFQSVWHVEIHVFHVQKNICLKTTWTYKIQENKFHKTNHKISKPQM